MIAIALLIVSSLYIVYDDVTTPSDQEAFSSNSLLESTASSGNAMSYNDKVTLLARTIHAEAEVDPNIGKVVVGAVLLNRINNSQFPNIFSGVIYQSSALESVSNGRINSTAEQQSRKATLGGWNPTYGALFFWNPNEPVNKWMWTRKITAQCRRHVFARYGGNKVCKNTLIIFLAVLTVIGLLGILSGGRIQSEPQYR